MLCSYCKEEIKGDYVELWHLAYPAHRLGYAHVPCSKKYGRIRMVVYIVVFIAIIGFMLL